MFWSKTKRDTRISDVHMAIGALAIALYKVIITYREYKIDSQKAVKQ